MIHLAFRYAVRAALRTALRITGALLLLLAGGALFATLAANAQTGLVGDTGMDVTGNYQSERAWCLANAADAARVDCLKEAGAASAEKRRGALESPADNFGANALLRCEAFQGQERLACHARVLGMGQSSGSVQGGAIIKEVETLPVPPGQAAVLVVPLAKR